MADDIPPVKQLFSKSDIPRVPATSADPNAERLASLMSLFPEAVTEGKIDFDRLRASLGDRVDNRKERYQFTWAGRADALRTLQAPTSATLVPDKTESVSWETTQNLFIEGDNLEVLKLLYKAYFGKVKLIYIDPPYNTGNDFIYPDNFSDTLQPYLRLTGQMDAAGTILTSNPETDGRYHSTWLSMMYPRLYLARQMLSQDGAIFISIDDHEAYNLRLLMNELFGDENFIGQIVWQKKVSPSNDARWFSSDHDYIVVYAKSASDWNLTRLNRTEKQEKYYKNPDNDPRGPWNSATYTCNKSRSQRPNLYYPIANPNTGEEIFPSETAVWAYSQELHQRHVKENLLYWGADGRSRSPRFKTFLSEAGAVVPRSVWPYTDVGHTQEATQELMAVFPEKIFDTPKPTRLLRRILQLATSADKPATVLDFFSGSAAFADAVQQQNQSDGGNRRYIVVQLPEPTGRMEFPTISDIGKERIRRAITKLKQAQPLLSVDSAKATPNLGFRVFKLAPSHRKGWSGVADSTPEAYIQQLDAFADPFLTGSFDPDAIVWEVAIREGYPLTSRVESSAVSGHVVHRVTDPNSGHSFHVCLDDDVSPDVVFRLGLTKTDLFVCRDSAVNDTAAANLALQCRLELL